MSTIVTIGDIKRGTVDDSPRFRLYIIRGDGCVLYVGKSQCAVTRMESHLGKGEWAGFFGSSLDYLLIEPAADDYTVELVDEQEIDQAVKKPWRLDQKVTWLESVLIYEFSPVYNSVGNQKSTDNARRWHELHPRGICNAGLVNVDEADEEEPEPQVEAISEWQLPLPLQPAPA